MGNRKLTLLVPGPGGFYLPRNETSYDPMHFDLESSEGQKPISYEFLVFPSLFGVQKTPK